MKVNVRSILYWLLVAIVLFGQVTLAWFIWTESSTALEAVGWITALVLPLAGFLYTQFQKRSIRFHLLTSRIQSRLSKYSPSWRLSLLMTGDEIQDDTFESVLKALAELQAGDKPARLRRLNSQEALVEYQNGPNLELVYSPADWSPIADLGNREPPYIKASINNYRVGFAQAAQAIRREVAPILEAIGTSVPKVETKYRLTVDFDKNKNPFIGYYIAQLPPDAIQDFSVRLSIDHYNPNDVVTISDSQIAIQTRTQSALQDLAIDFLSFDSALADHL